MPRGMFLKSDGFASNLSDPDSSFTLKNFCAIERIDYHDTRMPVALETFTRYGLAFQQKMVPELEDRRVIALGRRPRGFLLRLDNAEELLAERVVVAVGISYFAFVPPDLGHLPAEFLTHSSAHRTGDSLPHGKIMIIGAGASAVDTAAMLHENGTDVEVVARHQIKFHDPPRPETCSIWTRLRHPHSGIGPGIRSRFYTDAPDLFHRLPTSVRLGVVRRHLGPAAGWPVKEQVVGRVPFLEGFTVQRAAIHNDRVQLTLIGSNGEVCTREASHVIAATGYKVDLQRLSLLEKEIVDHLRSVENTPALSLNFESSIPGLFFVGLAASNSFGPLLRFAYGADFAARRIAAHLTRTAARRI